MTPGIESPTPGSALDNALVQQPTGVVREAKDASSPYGNRDDAAKILKQNLESRVRHNPSVIIGLFDSHRRDIIARLLRVGVGEEEIEQIIHRGREQARTIQLLIRTMRKGGATDQEIATAIDKVLQEDVERE